MRFGASIIIVAVAVTHPGSAEAETLYDANFNAEQLGPISTQPPTDPLPLMLPSRLIEDAPASIDVVTSAGSLTDQPVLIVSAIGALASASFYRDRHRVRSALG